MRLRLGYTVPKSKHTTIIPEVTMTRRGFDQEQSTGKAFALSGASPHYSPDRPGQVEHIALDLTLDLEQSLCWGTCTLRLNPIRDGIQHLQLDAVHHHIQTVWVDGEATPYHYDGAKLHIDLLFPTRRHHSLTLVVAYRLEQPQRGLYFIHPSPSQPKRRLQAWTQGEDEDSRFWFPCFDYPGQLATSSLRVQVPSRYRVISNGVLVKTETDSDSTTKTNSAQTIYTWEQSLPHPAYLITLAVGEFVEIQEEWQGIPVAYFVEADRQADVWRSLGKTPAMLSFFSETFGYPYPFAAYNQVCVADFIFGGMENTATTLLGDRYLLDQRAALDNRHTEALVAHELAHQWFGDLLVIKHWSHAWLKEGMASYAEVLWTEREYGPEAAAYYRLGQARQYLGEDSERYRRPIVTHIYREAIELYDHHLYEKGACVYHMLRAELGEGLFWQAIQTWVKRYAHQTVETIDLIRVIEQSTGRNLQYLFDQYVFRGGHPDFTVSYQWQADRKLAAVTVKQTQAQDDPSQCFDLTLPLAFGWVPDESAPTPVGQTFSLHLHQPEQQFYFPLERQPQWLSFDQGNHTLKTVNLDYPLPELQAQLRHDPDPIARIHAATALAKQGSQPALESLQTALQTDPFWGVRREIASQLTTFKSEQGLAALVLGLNDTDAQVRRGVVEAIAEFKFAHTQRSGGKTAYQRLKAIVKQGDPSYYVEAAALKGIGALAGSGLNAKPNPAKVLKHLQKALAKSPGWNEIIRIGALEGVSQLQQEPAVLEIIVSFTTPATPQPLRMAAIRALGNWGSTQGSALQTQILGILETLATESGFFTQMAVVHALKQIAHPQSITTLQSLEQRALDGRVKRWAAEAIIQVQKTLDPTQKLQTLQTELDQLRQEQYKLNSRLASLEASQGSPGPS
jgi:aminopeptidase N